VVLKRKYNITVNFGEVKLVLGFDSADKALKQQQEIEKVRKLILQSIIHMRKRSSSPEIVSRNRY
jgi:hypothetical protein